MDPSNKDDESLEVTEGLISSSFMQQCTGECFHKTAIY